MPMKSKQYRSTFEYPLVDVRRWNRIWTNVSIFIREFVFFYLNSNVREGFSLREKRSEGPSRWKLMMREVRCSSVSDWSRRTSYYERLDTVSHLTNEDQLEKENWSTVSSLVKFNEK